MAQDVPRFDENADWQAYDAPLPDDPVEWESTSSFHSGGSWSSRSSPRSRSPAPSLAPSSVPGAYLPPFRRGGTQDGVLQDTDGGVARVSRRGNLKNIGAPFDKPGAFRKIQATPFSLTDAQLKYMQRNFPNTFFQVTKDHSHDHPIAHLETMIATRQAIDTIHDGARILDMYGNPRSRDSFMQRRDLRGRVMESLVELKSEKDYLRQNTKWGPTHDANGNIRYHVMSMEDLLDAGNAGWAASFDVFLFIHTAYYVNMNDMVELLSRNPRSLAKLIVHRHPKEEGTMFNGEIDYTSRHGFVVQRNVETGERYVHSSLEWLFTSTTKVWRSATGALTWSFKRVTADTWIIDMTWCPNDLDERFQAYVNISNPAAAAHRMNEESLIDVSPPMTTPSLPGATVETFAGVMVVKAAALPKPLRITNVKYYEYLASSVVGKKRDTEHLADLFALARRENSLTSTFPGSRRFEVPVDQVADHVIAAFLTGLDREADLLSVVRLADDQVNKHRKMLEGQTFNVSTKRSMVRTGLKIAREINDVRRATDTFEGILTAIENRT